MVSHTFNKSLIKNDALLNNGENILESNTRSRDKSSSFQRYLQPESKDTIKLMKQFKNHLFRDPGFAKNP